MVYKANRPSNTSYQGSHGQQALRQNVPQSNSQNDDVKEFSYKGPDDFLTKAEEFAKGLAGDDGKGIGKSQLRKFYDQVISLRDEALQPSSGEKGEKIIKIIFKLRLLQTRVIYLSKRKSGTGYLVSQSAKKHLLGILERGIKLCKDSKDNGDIAEALKDFAMEFEAIYAYFYALSEKD
jgi:CRISPR type III-A-associated protein Csm2